LNNPDGASIMLDVTANIACDGRKRAGPLEPRNDMQQRGVKTNEEIVRSMTGGYKTFEYAHRLLFP
jgi:hypothetical protein